ncbi:MULTISPECIES: hypothetical protein [unclassified Aeromicrobium]
MNRFTWQQARRTALVLSCATFFTTVTVIGQVADPGPAPDPTHRLAQAR